MSVLPSKGKLDGSFSGLWTCELCGKTGTACTCEHFSRWGSAWGPRKRLTDAEAMAEFWHQDLVVIRAVDRAYPWGSSQEVETESERFATVARIAGIEI